MGTLTVPYSIESRPLAVILISEGINQRRRRHASCPALSQVCTGDNSPAIPDRSNSTGQERSDTTTAGKRSATSIFFLPTFQQLSKRKEYDVLFSSKGVRSKEVSSQGLRSPRTVYIFFANQNACFPSFLFEQSLITGKPEGRKDQPACSGMEPWCHGQESPGRRQGKIVR